MRVAIVKKGTILGVAEAASVGSVPVPPGCGRVELEDPDAGVGWTWDRDCWIPPAASGSLRISGTGLTPEGPSTIIGGQ